MPVSRASSDRAVTYGQSDVSRRCTGRRSGIVELVFRAKAEKNSNLPIMNSDDRHDGIQA
jgi:hypothetical protein